VLPVLRDWFAMAMNPMISGNAKEQIIVLAGRQRSIEASCDFEYAPLIHHGRVHSDIVAPQHVEIMRTLNASALCRSDWNAVCINQGVVPIDKRALAVSSDAIDPRFESLGKQSVVSIEKNQTIAGAGINTGITRSRQSAIMLAYKRNVLIPGGDLRRIVSRAVIHNDYLAAAVALVESAFYCVAKKPALVKARYDYRH
jgi:hypothetical protein